MLDAYTAGALRALARAQSRALQGRRRGVEVADLLAAFADEPEGRAAEFLARHGLAPEAILAWLGAGASPESAPPPASGEAPTVPRSPELQTALADAARIARRVDRNREIGTEHLLAALLEKGPTGANLEAAGLRLDELLRALGEAEEEAAGPIPMDAEIPALELASPSEAVDLGRVLDASANRAREGLRVVEDYVRFALDDPLLTRRLKEVRHRLDHAVRGLDAEVLIGSRDTTGDVGTHIMTASERTRESPRAVLSANFKRAGEALRTLEEFSKLIDVWVSGRFEVLRYDVYTLEKLVLSALSAHAGFADVKLYVLVGGMPTLGDLTWVVGEALAGGAQAIQLREKGLPDREYLKRAREVRILTAQAKARFVVNDRPDLARLAGADAVHLGQDDLSCRDARRIVGPKAILGVSAHDREQLRQAVLDGAGYLGVGPVFPSTTKDFDGFAGLGFVRHAAESTSLPWFAIGGITPGNLGEVIEAGASAVAVGAAVVHADSPKEAAREFRRRLEAPDLPG